MPTGTTTGFRKNKEALGKKNHDRVNDTRSWFFFSGLFTILNYSLSEMDGCKVVSRKPEMLMGVMLLVFVFLVSRHAGMMASGQNVVAGREKPVVVIDSGHPGTA